MTNCNVTPLTAFLTYLGYATIIAFGYIREWFRKLKPDMALKPPKGYAPLLRDFEDFYYRRMYVRASDCFHRPISSAPGAYIDVVRRETRDNNKHFTVTNETINCLNLGSYNYLGFAQAPKHVVEAVIDSVDKYGAGCASPYLEFGYTATHKEAEELVARYIGKEEALLVGMGFATNTTIIPSLAGPGTLIISDSLNHNSIVTGVRSSGAVVKVFKHSNMKQLEKIVRDAIIEGIPNKRRPWDKIIIVVEGIYSMEGEIVNLQEVVRIKKKYNCYLYIDEAHSIGALGKTGKGVCEQTGVDPADVDILMGTFTKSFGSVGGYIASSKAVISHLRNTSYSALYGTNMSVPAVQQIISVLKVILGEDGTTIGEEKIKQLKDSSNYFREELKKLGFEVIGDVDSPVVVVMLYAPGRILSFSRECLKRGVAVVVVGAPATHLVEARCRFCVSASHTREDLERALRVISEVGDLTNTKYCKSFGYAIKNILF